MEYDILSAHRKESLLIAVRERIEKGWKPLGGPVSSFDHIFDKNASIHESTSFAWNQAMTRETKREWE